MSALLVREYKPSDQAGVDRMMAGIAAEYPEAISGPQSVKLYEAYELPDQRYWVALDGEKIVGTIGLILLADGNAVLKRMMTDKDYRGAGTGLAVRLLRTALDWGRTRGVTSLFLGTMAQFTAARRFYSKQGCREVSLDDLPSDMVVNPIDTLHFRLDLEIGTEG